MPAALLILVLMAIIGLSPGPAQAETRIPGKLPQDQWKGCNRPPP